jgi:hypothetical protein
VSANRSSALFLMLSLLCISDTFAQGVIAPLMQGPSRDDVARYDVESGVCSRGSIQFLTKEYYDRIKAEWNEVEFDDESCVAVKMVSTGRRIFYPTDARGRLMSGGVHMLVQLERDGSIANVQPVCATSKAFAASAAKAVKKMTFTPMVCNSSPARSSILLPLYFDEGR